MLGETVFAVTKSAAVTLAIVIAGVHLAGCGGERMGPGAAPSTAPQQSSPQAPPTAPTRTEDRSATTTTPIFVDPPDPASRRFTTTVDNPPPVPVDQRALLERRAAEFELIDPRHQPADYLAISTRYCRRLVDEQTVREYGTAGSFGTAEERRLDLIERGTRVVGIDIFGYEHDRAQVEVRLEGDPPRGSHRIRQWVVEDGDWRVDSCAA